MTATFKELGLAPPLLQATEALGFTHATSVQEEVMPVALEGQDLMVSSQTGSGKTAAFLLPLLHQLITNPSQSKTPGNRCEPNILVLCPTRELAQQVSTDAINLVKFTRGIRVATIMGGMPYGKQLAQLKGANLVVATPGRLLDLSQSKAIRLDKVRCMVLDEADRMLDLGFQEDIEAIHELANQRSQTLMFSATFASRIMQLATRLMNNPRQIELASAQDKHENITQFLHWADNNNHKYQLLKHWLNDVGVEQAIVFASTQIDTEMISDHLRSLHFQATALHGAMPQAVRNRRLDSLRKGQTKILVATDVAARGIDIPTITHVINFGLPMKPEDYVHRIGRTGRAGRTGIAITLAEHRDRIKIRNIEHYIQQHITVEVIAGLEPKEKARQPSHRPGSHKPRRPSRSNAGHAEPKTAGFKPGGHKSSAPKPGAAKPEFGAAKKPNHFAKPRGPKMMGGFKKSSKAK